MAARQTDVEIKLLLDKVQEALNRGGQHAVEVVLKSVVSLMSQILTRISL